MGRQLAGLRVKVSKAISWGVTSFRLGHLLDRVANMDCPARHELLESASYRKRHRLRRWVHSYQLSWEEALRSLRQFDERAEKIEQRSLLSQPEFVRLFTEEHACQAPTSPVDEDAQRQLAFLIFRIFDADGDGYLNRKEFMAWAGTQRGSAVARKLDASFRAFDARHKGRLSKEDVVDMLSITSRSAHAFIGRSVAEGEDPLPFLHSITDDLFAHFGRKGAISRRAFRHGFVMRPDIAYPFLLF